MMLAPDADVDAVLDTLPRATATSQDIPKLVPNAVVYIDSVGRLNILGEFGLLTIDDEDLHVLDIGEL